MSDSSLSSKIGFLVASLNRQLEKEMESHLRPLKLPVDQVRVLEALAGPRAVEGLIMSELAQLALIDPSTLTKVIDRMISDSLVYRASDPADRRRVKVLLGPKGFALFGKLRPLLESQERELQKSIEGLLNDNGAESLTKVLEHLCNRPSRSDDPGVAPAPSQTM